jgi:hypothetical protein
MFTLTEFKFQCNHRLYNHQSVTSGSMQQTAHFLYVSLRRAHTRTASAQRHSSICSTRLSLNMTDNIQVTMTTIIWTLASVSGGIHRKKGDLNKVNTCSCIFQREKLNKLTFVICLSLYDSTPQNQSTPLGLMLNRFTTVPTPTIHFLKIHFNVIFPSSSLSFKRPLSKKRFIKIL